MGLAHVARDAGELAEARAGFEEARDIFERISTPVDLARSLIGLAQTERQAGNVDEAREAMEKAAAISKRIGDPRGAEAARKGLAKLGPAQK